MELKFINAMRMLALQAIKKAKQGHVGMSISAAPLVYSLYTKHINLSSKEPKWFNRDRFILSAGHGSLSIYTILHFANLLSIEDIKEFKTKNSKTPGHPEWEHDNYIDASTGPLGQGTAMAVGMAIAEKYLENKFSNLKGLIDHHTYAVLGDGDLQEGICYESMSLAGKLNLNKLIFLHDSNDFQLDSSVDKVFNENLKLRMESMNWKYIKSTNKPIDINCAIEEAKKSNKPTFIEVKTIIGEGVKTQNSNKAHSMSLSQEDLDQANNYFATSHVDFKFEKDIYDHFQTNVITRGNDAYKKWLDLFEKYKKQYPQDIKKLTSWLNEDFSDIEEIVKKTNFISKNVATRNYVKDFLSEFDKNHFDWLISGCADLIAATNIKLGEEDFNSNTNSNNILFGIREFAMSGITNGILLHKGLRTVSGSFLVFSDYMKSAIRLGALMKLPNFYIFTHDSYQVGGDGPTHQPVDQLTMLRGIPNVIVHKPCDEVELSAAMSLSLTSKNLTNIIILTRHSLSSEHKTSYELSKKGGYVLYSDKNPDITLAGCGSEIDLLFEVKKLLEKDKIKVKIVSLPSIQILLNKNHKSIQTLLSSKKGLFTIEPSSDSSWYKLQKFVNHFFHLEANSFGLSMDGDELYKLKGFNATNIRNLIKKHIL